VKDILSQIFGCKVGRLGPQRNQSGQMKSRGGGVCPSGDDQLETP